MQYPQLIILESAGWVARQLADWIRENRWLVREPRSPNGVLLHVREPRPTVVMIEIDPASDRSEAIALISRLHEQHSDLPLVAISDVKLPDTDRAVWTATLLDLGARYVLFPPVTQSVLEDVASGLMEATIRRVVGGEASRIPPTPQPSSEGPIDLADMDD